MRFLLALFLGLSLCSCAHRAKHYAAPDPSAMTGSSERWAAADARARDAAKRAREKSTAQRKELTAISPKLENLFHVAPADLRPAIAAIQFTVGAMQSRQGEIEKHQADLETNLQTSEEEQGNHVVDQNKFIEEARKITDRLNAAELARAKDSKALLWYRVHWFLGIVFAVGGVVLCALFAFLKFTGRLALAGAKIGL